MNHYLDDLRKSSHHILLLQGPVGYFFAEFSDWLKQQGKTVFKINFNAGDEYFYPKNKENTFSYTKEIFCFSDYLTHFCDKYHIDNIVCFGDNRKYHKIAKAICQKRNIGFWVFEEGYFRPHYITFEKSGVNAFSNIPKNAEFFNSLSQKLSISPPQKLASGFYKMAKQAICYYTFANLNAKYYPNYQNHKEFNLKYYIKLWTKSFIKRICYYFKDRKVIFNIKNGKYGDFFILALQVHNDSQVEIHSDYDSIKPFLAEVLVSFAQYAPQGTHLIVKHHPMDRGFIDYREIIEAYCRQYPTLKNRIIYVHDVPMPLCLRHGKGMVTLNSTSGISAMFHHMPVKTLGRANYDFKGLTHQGSLAEFWQQPEPPDPAIFKAFQKYHLNKTQINGSFYNKVIFPK